MAVVMVMALDDNHDDDCVIMGQSGWVGGWVASLSISGYWCWGLVGGQVLFFFGSELVPRSLWFR